MTGPMVEAGGVLWPPAPDWRAWRHVAKLDPDRPLDERTLALVYASGTDAILVGGSTGMTRDSVFSLLDQLMGAPVPVALEVSTLEAAMPGPGLFLVPFVLNTRQAEWKGGAQTAAMERILPAVGPMVPWHLILPEAYLVLNPAATVAQMTGAETGLSPAGAAAHAAFAGRVLLLPLIYVEYSGAFGEMDVLRAVKEHAGAARVFYGGGIATAEQAAAAGAIADTIVVGNLIYSEPERLRETVLAVR